MKRLLERLLSILHESSFEVLTDRKFRKNLMKLKSKPAKIKLVDEMIDELKKTGNIDGHGLHTIKQPIKSGITGTTETGWKVVYVSKTDDARLAYLKHKDGTIEVKFGTARDIGYKH